LRDNSLTKNEKHSISRVEEPQIIRLEAIKPTTTHQVEPLQSNAKFAPLRQRNLTTSTVESKLTTVQIEQRAFNNISMREQNNYQPTVSHKIEEKLPSHHSYAAPTKIFLYN
jgi:hypothetical protein